MKRDGEQGGARDFLFSLGSGAGPGSSSRLREGDNREAEETESEPCTRMWSSLSRNGLNMLAGFGNGGFSLRPPQVGGDSGTLRGNVHNTMSIPATLQANRSASSSGGGSERMRMVTGGGGFAGFYRSSLPSARLPDVTASTQRISDDGVGASSFHKESFSVAGKKVEHLGEGDIMKLTREECWRLILKLGKRWPTWKKIAAPQSSQGFLREQGSAPEPMEHGNRPLNEDGTELRGSFESLQIHQLGQSCYRLLANRALEELARTPDRFRSPAGGLRQSLQEKTETPAAVDASTPAAKVTGPPAPAFTQQPTPVTTTAPSATPPTMTPRGTHGMEASGKQPTAPLTIFYAGTVNVCDNVPEDKAHIIMLLAERAGSSAAAQTQAPRIPAAPARALPQLAGTSATPTPPPETAQQQEGTQFPRLPTLREKIEADTSPVLPSELTASSQAAVTSSVQGPAERSNLPQMPAQINMIQRQQTPQTRPLAVVRKASLARFLDCKQKRARVSNSSGGPDGLSSKIPLSHLPLGNTTGDLKNTDGQKDKSFCIHSSISSKEDTGAEPAALTESSSPITGN